MLDCLRKDPEMSTVEIKKRGLEIQQTISDSIISMAHADFKNQHTAKVEIEKVVGD